MKKKEYALYKGRIFWGFAPKNRAFRSNSSCRAGRGIPVFPLQSLARGLWPFLGTFLVKKAPKKTFPKTGGLGVLAFLVSLLFCSAAGDSVWYISNSSGMAVEKTFKSRALREKYALQVATIDPKDIPPALRRFYSYPWRAECRVLYETGKRQRTQWTYWDSADTLFFAAAIGNDGAGFIEWFDEKGRIVEEQRIDADGSGYYVSYTYQDAYLLKARATAIEPYLKKEPGAAAETAAEAAPPQTEAAEKETPPAAAESVPEPEGPPDEEALLSALFAPDGAAEDAPPGGASPAAAPPAPAGTPAPEGAPASVEAPAPAGAPASAGAPAPSGASAPREPSLAQRVRDEAGALKAADFPATFVARAGREGKTLWVDTYRYARAKTIRVIERRIEGAGAKDALKMRLPRSIETDSGAREFVDPANSFSSAFLAGLIHEEAARVQYNTDARRRIIQETYYNSEDAVIAEVRNSWKDDRLTQVDWKSGEEERRIEYVYNKSKDRVAEYNYHNGELERTITVDEKQEHEIERIYKNKELMLEAVWKDGRKISEKRVTERRP